VRVDTTTPTDSEKPRFAFDISGLSVTKPTSIVSVAITDALGVAAEDADDLVVSTETDTTNAGVRNYLVMSKVVSIGKAEEFRVVMFVDTVGSGRLKLEGVVHGVA